MNIANQAMPARPRITRREWWLAGLIAIVAVSLAAWPTVHGWLATPPNMVYTSTIVPDLSDGQVYFGFIEQNAQGHFLYRNVFSGEMQKAVLWHPLWLILGLAQNIARVTPMVAFFAGRIVFGLGLVMLIYAAVSRFVRPTTWRTVTTLVIVFGGGFGGWLFLFVWPHTSIADLIVFISLYNQFPVDMMFSGLTITSLYHSPLYIAVQISLIAFAWFFWRSVAGQPRFVHAAGAVALFLTLIHPYDWVLMMGMLFAWLCLSITLNDLRPETGGKLFIRHSLIVFLWTVPGVLYYALAIWSEPVIRAWTEKNVLLPPSWRSMFLGYGLLGPLAAIGTVSMAKRNRSLAIIPIGWVAAAIVLLYMPKLSFQAKMLDGFGLPLGLLAAQGIRTLWTHLRRIPFVWMRRCGLFIIAVGLVAGLGFSPPYIFWRTTVSQRQDQQWHYLPHDTVAAMRWIHQHTPDDSLILATPFIGNWVPAYAGRPTYVAHVMQTVAYWPKRAEVRDWFFRQPQQFEDKAAFLRAHSIDYVFWTGQSGLGLENISNLKLVFQTQAAAVFEVTD